MVVDNRSPSVIRLAHSHINAVMCVAHFSITSVIFRKRVCLSLHGMSHWDDLVEPG